MSSFFKSPPFIFIQAGTLIIFTILFLFSPWRYGLGYQLLIGQRILPKIYVNNSYVGLKKVENVGSFLVNNLKDRFNHIVISSGKTEFILNENDIGLQYEINQTLSKIYPLGHRSEFGENISDLSLLAKQPVHYPYELIYDEMALNSFVASISGKLNQPEITPTISIIINGEQKTASVSAGSPGRLVDEHQLKKDIINSFSTQSSNHIEIPYSSNYKSIPDSQIEKTSRLANNLINKTLILSHDDLSWKLDDETLINFLSLHDTFDELKIASWSGELAATINHEPINALFEFEGNRVKEFKAAKKGVKLNTDKTIERIESGILSLSSSLETEYTIDLIVDYTDPEITTNTVNDLGIKERIGLGESWFSHSIPGRIHNVALSSSRIHGVLVEPGEVFSFVEQVGEIDAAHGYKQSYIIKDGKTILGDGGGVCQTSTTLFRAALDAGLEIVERNAHAYRVGYYEQNYEVGVDATIFSPSVDLKFRNDTGHHILIQTFVDQKNTYAKFEIYGTDDGRQVTISKSKLWDQTAPPPARYQDDPTLPVGVVKQVDWAAWGAKASFDWKVVRNGKILHEKTFYSNYRPWQAVYLKGTGGV